MPWSTSGRIEAQSSRPGDSNTDSSHDVVLQAFVYKTAKPRQATNTLEYQKKCSISRHAPITTLGNSSFSSQYNINPEMEIGSINQQINMVLSGKQSTKSYGTQRQEIIKVIWYVPGKHDALAAGTSSDLPAVAQILSL